MEEKNFELFGNFHKDSEIVTEFLLNTVEGGCAMAHLHDRESGAVPVGHFLTAGLENSLGKDAGSWGEVVYLVLHFFREGFSRVLFKIMSQQ